MKPSHRQPVAAGLAAAVLSMAVAGCGSVRAQSQQWYTPADGVSAEAGDLSVRNVLVVADDSGDAATLLASFANRGDEDALHEVRVNDTSAAPTGGSLSIPAGGYATLGPGSTRLDVGSAGTVPGRFVEVEFIFADAPRVSVDALVQRAEAEYDNALIAPRGTPVPP